MLYKNNVGTYMDGDYQRWDNNPVSIWNMNQLIFFSNLFIIYYKLIGGLFNFNKKFAASVGQVIYNQISI